MRRIDYFLGYLFIGLCVWMCVGFCSWADLCITHASWGRCAKRCSECHWVPIPLCHIVCECMHAYDSCATEMQKSTCLFIMKRKERGGKTVSHLGLTSFWNPLFRLDKSRCVCRTSSVCVYCRLRSSGPFILLPRHNWQRNPGASLARIACCSTVWHPKHWRAGSFYSWHEHVCVWGSVWACVCVCVRTGGESLTNGEMERCDTWILSFFGYLCLFSSSPYLRDKLQFQPGPVT